MPFLCIGSSFHVIGNTGFPVGRQGGAERECERITNWGFFPNGDTDRGLPASYLKIAARCGAKTDENRQINTLVLRRGNGLIVVDNGAAGLFGPTTGKIGERLSALGISPDQVTAVVLTHAHGDHFGGLLDKEGKPTYPNAAHFVSKAELDFWTAPEPDLSRIGIPPENRKPFIATVQKYLGALKARITPVQPGQSILPGVEVVGAPGHTPGHVALLVTSDKESLFNTADSVHHPMIFGHPEWMLAFDVDPKQAIATRRKILDRAASDRLRVLAYHLPYPGLGHVRPAKGAYDRWGTGRITCSRTNSAHRAARSRWPRGCAELFRRICHAPV